MVAEHGTMAGNMALKLGIYLNSQHPAGDDPARRFAETVEQVRLVRSLGFDSIWAGEHHVTPGFHFFPQLPLLHRLAAVWRRKTRHPTHYLKSVAGIGELLSLQRYASDIFHASGCRT